MLTKNDKELNRKSHKCKVVSWTPHGVYRVWSPSGNTYTVDLGRGRVCSCRWGRRGGSGCAHERCARRHWAALKENRAVSFMVGQPGDVARKQHKATRPMAVQGDAALTVVLRDRVDEVARLDAEINALGREYAAARHRWYMVDSGPEKYHMRDEMDRIRPLLMDLQYERAAAARLTV